MPTKILMPALSPTMESGSIAKWLVDVGDKVSSGDVLCEIETDKATMELEAIDEGVIGKILVPALEKNVKVNSEIAILLEDGEILDDNSKNDASASGAENKEVMEKAATAEKDSAVDTSSLNSQSTNNQSTVLATDSNLTQTSSSVAKNGPKAAKLEIFDKETQSQTVREALRDAMVEEMDKDERVYLLGEEVGEYQGAYKVSLGMLERFGPLRVIDTPITEMGFTGLAVGTAYNGMRPIVEYMTFNFSMQAIDHIINSAAKTLYMSGGKIKVPVVFRGPNGAAARVAAQHSQCYASWYAHCPGLKVIAPFSSSDAKGLLKSAILDDSPVIFLENEILYGHSFDVPLDKDYLVPIGKAKLLTEGNDVTIISFSHPLIACLAAAEELKKNGTACEVIDLRTIRPLDKDAIIASVMKTNRLVVVEEGWPYAGIASEIISIVQKEAFDYLDAPIIRICAEDVPLPYSETLEKLALPSTEKIVRAVKQVLYLQ